MCLEARLKSQRPNYKQMFSIVGQLSDMKPHYETAPAARAQEKPLNPNQLQSLRLLSRTQKKKGNEINKKLWDFKQRMLG